MLGWLLLGLVVGFAAGFATAWLLRRTPASSAGRSLAPESQLGEPLVGAESDEEISQALDATKGLLDELEGRYRGRTAPADEESKPKRRPRRR